MKKKIVVLKDNKVIRTKEEFIDEDKNRLIMVKEGNGDKLSKEEIKALRGRKLLEEKFETSFVVTRGESYREKKVELVPELTSAMLSDGSWEKTEFK